MMRENHIKLETKRLTLRELNSGDISALCKILQDREVMYAYEHTFSDSEVDQWLKKQSLRYKTNGFGLWAVCLRTTGEMIGQCGLTMQEWGDREVLEIGYLFQKRYWHNGYATEAAQACKKYAFEELNASEVFSIIRDNNVPSKNVAKRNGMTICGNFTKHYYGIDMPHTVFSVKRKDKKMIEEELVAKLFEMQDLKYRDFHSKMMPTIDKDTIIGVRTPQLRKFAKDFSKTDDAKEFLKSLPHKYYEENNLHGFLIESIKDFNSAIISVNEFLPYVDNWATCDMMSPKVFKKQLPELLKEIKKWVNSDKTYTIRFGIGMLMAFFLDDEFSIEYPTIVSSIRSDEYYVNMMIAWYFATALAKQYDSILPFIKEQKLDTWVHNKAIQKSIESYRITDEQKTYLRTLKIPLKK